MGSRRGLWTVSCALMLATVVMPPSATMVSTTVVISQIYGGGGNAGATLKNDFIELYNLGSSPVNLTGWSVQYASSAGSTWQLTALNGTLGPGDYYLIQEAAGAGGTQDLPTPNAVGSIAMSATAGKIALVNATAALGGSCPTGLVDFVGYGSAANCFEGTGPAPTLSNTTAALRAVNGSVDTDRNDLDFSAGTPNPRNSAPPAPPVVVTPIHDIQGTGSASPFVNQAVATQGIVTAVRGNGFYIQLPDAQADANPISSEGIFVFTSGAPPAAAVVGNMVRVTGTVSEFKGDPNSPPLTEISSPSVVVLSSGHVLPAPKTITAADTAASGSPEQLERLEGMRVHADSLTTISPTLGSVNEPNATGSSNGVFYAVITGVARPFREPGIDLLDPLPAGSPCCVPRFDTNPERLRVDSDGQIGATLLELTSNVTVMNVTGVLDYGFRTYTILPDPSPVPTVTPNMSAVPLPQTTGDQLTIASFNMQRFFDDVNDPLTGDAVLTTIALNNRLDKVSLAIRDIMRSPDVIGVAEVENLATLHMIAAKVNTDAVAGGDPDPDYQAYLFEGNDPGGIDVGFLVKTSSIQVISVSQAGKDATYTNPITNQQDLLNDRPPVVLKATVRSMAFTVIVNHMRSFLGIDDAADGPRVRAKRRAQAEFLASLIQALQTTDPAEKIVVVGDFNAFQFNDGYVDTIGVIHGTPAPASDVVLASDDVVDPDLINLTDTINDPYSYVFDGNAQTIDHVMITQNLYAQLVDLAYARSDADFPETYRNDSLRPERVSDHDIPVAYFTIPNAAPTAVDDVFGTAENGSINGTVLGNDTDADGDALTVVSNTAPANGALTIMATGAFTYTPHVGFSGIDSFTYTVDDGHGGTDGATVTITVHPNVTLTVAVLGSGSGTVAGAGIDCGADCTETYATFPDVQSVALAATAFPGSVFLGWSGDCSGTGSCTLTMNANHDAHATFAAVSTGGRMTGAGTSGELRTSIDMSCSLANRKARLDIRWANDNAFHLDSRSSVVCYDDASIAPKQKNVAFDTVIGTGVGRFNDAAATIEWRVTDAGEPSGADTVSFTIRVGNTVVSSYTGTLSGGNYQAHKN